MLCAAIIGTVIAILAWWLFAPSGLVCFGEAIETSDQAIAFAKQIIAKRSGVLDEAQMASAADYDFSPASPASPTASEAPGS